MQAHTSGLSFISAHIPRARSAIRSSPPLIIRGRCYASPRWRAKLQVQVVSIGKRSGKDTVFDDQIAELVKRMRPVMEVESRWIKPGAAVQAVREMSAAVPVVLLDEAGAMPKDSVQFSSTLYELLERGGSRLSFVIGDAEGLPSELVQDARGGRAHNLKLLSLGPLTFTHKMVCTALALLYTLFYYTSASLAVNSSIVEVNLILAVQLFGVLGNDSWPGASIPGGATIPRDRNPCQHQVSQMKVCNITRSQYRPLQLRHRPPRSHRNRCHHVMQPSP